MSFSFEGITETELIEYMLEDIVFVDGFNPKQELLPYLEKFIENCGLSNFPDDEEFFEDLFAKKVLEWPDFESRFFRLNPELTVCPSVFHQTFEEACWSRHKDNVIGMIKELCPGVRFNKSKDKDYLISFLKERLSGDRQKEIIEKENRASIKFWHGIKLAKKEKWLKQSLRSMLFAKCSIASFFARTSVINQCEHQALRREYFEMKTDSEENSCFLKYGERVLKRYDDDFWITESPPHNKITCRCRLSSLHTRNLNSDDLKLFGL